MEEHHLTNPLLQRAQIPGQTFALPSGGIFYEQGELDDSVDKGEVVVCPMVTLDELVMKTPDKILNGTAITEVFGRCIPQIKKPDMLLAKDVDFLLICLRKVTYGDQYQIEHMHDCENATKHSYLVPLDPLISEAKKLNTDKARDDYTLTLPNQQVVKLSPPKYTQMLKFYQSLNDQVSEEVAYHRIIDATVSIVDSVDDVKDKKFIREWAAKIPAGYTKRIGERVMELGEWGPMLTSKITCRDCGKEVSVNISLNPMHFFS